MKKLSLILLALVLLCCLTACGCEHEWVAATCEADSYCSLCKKAEEGTALGHDYAPANYQQPEICKVCGAENGERLKADFETYDMGTEVALDQTFDYRNKTGKEGKETVASASFSKYHILDKEADADLIAKLEKACDYTMEFKDGYEWRAVFCNATYSDYNARKYAPYQSLRVENYYDIKGFDDDVVWENRMGTFNVNWNGEEYTDCVVMDAAEWTKWKNQKCSYQGWIAFMVPEGYDGCVVAYRSTLVEIGDEQHLYEVDNTDTYYFRLK